MQIKQSLPLIITILLILNACKKDKNTPTDEKIDEKGIVSLRFDNEVNGKPLVLNSETYQNANGDSFTVSTFKYYISNITFIKADGSSYKVPESYLLMDASKPTSLLNQLNNIPVGDYTKVSFIIGVDKERNISGAQTGALDPANDMFWTRNSGYVFVKMEGVSPQSTATNQKLSFHVGGFSEPNNTIRTFSATINNPNELRIRTDKKPNLHFKVNLANLFTGKTNIDFSKLNSVMEGANAVIMADNYASGMFKLDHIHNDTH